MYCYQSCLWRAGGVCLCVCVCVLGSTIDMMFVARLQQEKCREQHQSPFFAFIDSTKAFYTVNRELLWKVLSKFGCPPHFLQILRKFHDGMSARVTVGGHESDPFDVLVGSNKAACWLPSFSTYSWLLWLWFSEMDCLQMLESASISGLMVTYPIQYQTTTGKNQNLIRYHIRPAVCRWCSDT